MPANVLKLLLVKRLNMNFWPPACLIDQTYQGNAKTTRVNKGSMARLPTSQLCGRYLMRSVDEVLRPKHQSNATKT